MKKISKKIKQNIYKWHRTLGIITLIPALFWSLSGVMHPFMSHLFKPEIAHDKIAFQPIDTTKLTLSLQDVLSKNKINQFKNFRIIAIDTSYYYQVRTIFSKYRYFNTQNAVELKKGDLVYAEYLSRYFIDDQKSTIKSITEITQFSTQYKYINRYLPVYKVTFNRNDNVDVYVETNSSKLATFNPTARKVFLEIFDVFHNWGFIDAIANNSLRIIIMLLLLSVISFSALSGLLIYAFFYKQFRIVDANASSTITRKRHRKLGVFVSFFTLLFAFSGGYHAIQKWKPNPIQKMVYSPIIKVSELKTVSNKLNIDWKKLSNLSLIKQNDSIFYQCQFLSAEDSDGKRALSTEFINDKTNLNQPNKQADYALFLAKKFAAMQTDEKANCCETEERQISELSKVKLLKTEILNDFDKRDYGFVNKRLPVVKLEFKTPQKTTYYIDTSASQLAARVTNTQRNEGLSFAFLHKFLYLDWAGKTIRDLFSVLIAVLIASVSVLGLKLFLKKK